MAFIYFCWFVLLLSRISRLFFFPLRLQLVIFSNAIFHIDFSYYTFIGLVVFNFFLGHIFLIFSLPVFFIFFISFHISLHLFMFPFNCNKSPQRWNVVSDSLVIDKHIFFYHTSSVRNKYSHTEISRTYCQFLMFFGT